MKGDKFECIQIATETMVFLIGGYYLQLGLSYPSLGDIDLQQHQKSIVIRSQRYCSLSRSPHSNSSLLILARIQYVHYCFYSFKARQVDDNNLKDQQTKFDQTQLNSTRLNISIALTQKLAQKLSNAFESQILSVAVNLSFLLVLQVYKASDLHKLFAFYDNCNQLARPAEQNSTGFANKYPITILPSSRRGEASIPDLPYQSQ